jgi:hypothetical protein
MEMNASTNLLILYFLKKGSFLNPLVNSSQVLLTPFVTIISLLQCLHGIGSPRQHPYQLWDVHYEKTHFTPSSSPPLG